MAKKKVQFESFPDGVCKLWQLDGGKRPVLLLSGVRYRERTVGERRNFDAEQAGHTIQMLIRIPQMDFVKPGVFVTIGDQQYKVLQAQKINDTLPVWEPSKLRGSRTVSRIPYILRLQRREPKK